MTTDPLIRKMVRDTVNSETKDEEEVIIVEPEKAPKTTTVTPSELSRTFETIPGLTGVMAPVEEITDYITSTQKQKLDTIEASKKITDLAYANKHKAVYIEKLKQAVEAAIQKGDKQIILPALPVEMTQRKETKTNEDLEDTKFMKEMMKLTTQHAMMLKAQDRMLGENKKEERDIIEITYPDGTQYKGPADRAPKIDSDNNKLLTTLIDRLNTIETTITNPYHNQPKIRLPTGKQDSDGEEIYADLPIDYAIRYGLLPQTTNNNSKDKDYEQRLLTLLEKMTERQTPSSELIIQQIEEKRELEERRLEAELMRYKRIKELFNPTISVAAPNSSDELERERIRAQATIAKAKEEKDTAAWNALGKALEPVPKSVSEKEIGTDFLRKIRERVQAEGQ